MKVTITEKTTKEVDIITPSFRKSNEKFYDEYFYFTKTHLISVSRRSLRYFEYTDFNKVDAANEYFNSFEVNPQEFFDFYDLFLENLNKII